MSRRGSDRIKKQTQRPTTTHQALIAINAVDTKFFGDSGDLRQRETDIPQSRCEIDHSIDIGVNAGEIQRPRDSGKIGGVDAGGVFGFDVDSVDGIDDAVFVGVVFKFFCCGKTRSARMRCF
ncbi:hypothetical protein PQX77_012124 [Marasmius sp. AFHP31]|nr:hypothetical protein PQX77_012124 [Marasmius sp. AFHP31]